MPKKRIERETLQELKLLLKNIEDIIEIVIVEGQRDIEALRKLGFKGKIISYSQIGVTDFDFVEKLASNNKNILILTDFDKEGRAINHRLVHLFETRGVKVEMGLRWAFRRIMASLGIYAIESLDNITDRISNRRYSFF